MKTKIDLDLIIRELQNSVAELNKNCDYVINCGGCGIFADKVYKLLKKHGYEPEILVQIYDSMDKDWAETNLRGGNGPDSIAWKHIIIKVGDCFIDSENICKAYSSNSLVEGMNYETLKKMD